MKKLILTTTAFIVVLLANAQIKVNSGGPIAMGYTTAVTSGYAAQIKGSTLFTSATGTTSASGAAIVGTNTFSAAGGPDYSWNGDLNTGIYHPTNEEIDFSTNGTQRAQLTQWELNLMNLQYGLKITAPSNGNWPNAQIIFPSSPTYTIAANNSYGYVLTYQGTDVFYTLGTGDIHYKNGWVTSDSSIKKNVTTVGSAMNKINKMRGVTFKYNYSNTALNDPNETAIGVIAQEVKRVVPEAVKTTKDGILAVNYQGLVGLLIEGMKEQDKKIDSLKQQLSICCPQKTGQRTSGSNNNSPQQDSINKSLQQQINNCCKHSQNGSSATGNNSATATLQQNIPNPFNQTTSIKCFIPSNSKASSLLVFDMNGTLKKTIPISGTGEQNLTINGKELIAGMYYYTLIIDGNEIDTKKMILTEQ